MQNWRLKLIFLNTHINFGVKMCGIWRFRVNEIVFAKFIKISHLNLIFQNLHLAFGKAILHNSLKFCIPKIKLLKVALNFKIWCKKYKLNANLLVCFYQILRSNFTLKFLLENSFKIQISHCFLPNRLNFITKFSQNLVASKTLKNIFQIAPQSLNFTSEFLKINILMSKNYA